MLENAPLQRMQRPPTSGGHTVPTPKFDRKSYTLILQLDAKLDLSDIEHIAEERGLQRKSEFHITLIGNNFGKKIRDALHKITLPISERQNRIKAIQSLISNTDWNFRFNSERYYLSHKRADATSRGDGKLGNNAKRPAVIIWMVDLPALNNFYASLNDIVGTNLQAPPAHITLFTNGLSIGVNSWEDLKQWNAQLINRATRGKRSLKARPPKLIQKKAISFDLKGHYRRADNAVFDLLTQHRGEIVGLNQAISAGVVRLDRQFVQSLFVGGYVFVNGLMANKGSKIQAGDRVSIAHEALLGAGLHMASREPVDVLFESEHFLVVAKPAGIPTVPEAGLHSVSVQEWLIQNLSDNLREFTKQGPLETVSRLDKDTSGVLLLATTHLGYKYLKKLIANHQVTKEYLCLVPGEFPRHWTIEDPLTNTSEEGKNRMKETQTAITHFESERCLQSRRFGSWTLLRARPVTGRNHQIRKHLQLNGFPIAGDRNGNPSVNRIAGEFRLHRMFLHAEKLQFNAPVELHASNWPGQARAPLPLELQLALEALVA